MNQFDLFGESTQETSDEVVYNLKDAKIIYYPNFFGRTKVDFEALKNSLNLRQDQITLYGKTHDIPRLQAWYSNDMEYSYSGIKLLRNDWNKELKTIKDEIEAITGESFNGCLCNLYRDGRDYASWHSDDEESLGRNPVIASASFGETRKFVLKHRFDKSCEKVEIELEDRSLLIMKGATQHYWKHQLNKTARKVGPRINLTFRRIIR
ncbi:alpha-ketoglutarate-dependent dioxygenase AlkB [Halobacteriovorax vibrionivorans]|uniref:Alpha-ketoglutarate-dependent dioxygenase AlkB n=1 Tax=Halobacteriovorax vibrionivorans TaxID=2152716 RepID=A0ABY0IEB3_9BACT|nr:MULTISPECIES: alpha-ketoglutarate-dependent dioxygenase AlkB [Halobacteriovorax]RZF20940.1 alpha-ketoglutarate-dependent dioxygenase AlkB [Halobacteriovorax vibrionivorans]TGD46040.1 alpha-ketoglutarate-dependent dioxygenase AlkB [Halobacteriovorax sp. Y22]